MSVTLTEEEVKEVLERLLEVRDKIGPYKIDPTEFAWSVMETSSDHALWMLALLKEAQAR